MFDTLGLRSRPAFLPYASGNESSKEFNGGFRLAVAYRSSTKRLHAVRVDHARSLGGEARR